MDHSGNNAKAQIDLIIVAADAQVLTPSNLEGGKINVLCDQVIAAIMVTSILKPEKLRGDWIKLQRVSELFKFTDEFPEESPQAWPLCYIVSGQSASSGNPEKTWTKLVEKTSRSSFVPQFLMSLDSGFLYSGATAWPRPSYPGNYVKRNQVSAETGIWSGLGLAWILTQIRARHALMLGRPTHAIERFSKLLDKAALKSATPPTWSDRFSAGFKSRPIQGVLHWGRRFRYPHNRVLLASLGRQSSDGDLDEFPIDPSSSQEGESSPRWFRHPATWKVGRLVALEEWTASPDNIAPYTKSYSVFDSETGEEVHLAGPLTEAAEGIEAALAILLENSEIPSVDTDLRP
jgi:hypothetical protein